MWNFDGLSFFVGGVTAVVIIDIILIIVTYT